MEREVVAPRTPRRVLRPTAGAGEASKKLNLHMSTLPRACTRIRGNAGCAGHAGTGSAFRLAAHVRGLEPMNGKASAFSGAQFRRPLRQPDSDRYPRNPEVRTAQRAALCRARECARVRLRRADEGRPPSHCQRPQRQRTDALRVEVRLRSGTPPAKSSDRANQPEAPQWSFSVKSSLDGKSSTSCLIILRVEAGQARLETLTRVSMRRS
jgi:hypothetical protein